MILGEGNGKPIIGFPCQWKFTIIGKDPILIEKRVKAIVEKYNYNLSPSRASKKGKYYSFHLAVDVPTEEEKDFIYKKLKDNNEITLVL